MSFILTYALMEWWLYAGTSIQSAIYSNVGIFIAAGSDMLIVIFIYGGKDASPSLGAIRIQPAVIKCDLADSRFAILYSSRFMTN